MSHLKKQNHNLVSSWALNKYLCVTKFGQNKAYNTEPTSYGVTRHFIIIVNSIIIKASFMLSGSLPRIPYFYGVKGRTREKHRGVEGTKMKRG
jgi:hypothetical protein